MKRVTISHGRIESKARIAILELLRRMGRMIVCVQEVLIISYSELMYKSEQDFLYIHHVLYISKDQLNLTSTVVVNYYSLSKK